MLIAIFFIFILFLLVFITSYLQMFYTSVAILIFIVALLLFFLFLLIIEGYQIVFKGKVPYLPSTNRLIKAVLKEINIKKDSIVYDLGSGDGKVLRFIRKKHKVKAIGYEKFFLPFFISLINNVFAFKKCKFYCKDFYNADLSEADYVFCYLLPKEQERLVNKLNKELKPGTVVIVNSFKMPGWQEEKEIRVKKKNVLGGRLYIYNR